MEVAKKALPVEKFSFRPLNKRILIRRISREYVTPGGIVIPNIKNGMKVPHGKVMAVADNCELGMKVGEVVYFNPAMMSEVHHPEGVQGIEEYFVTHENNIEGVIG